MKLSVYRGRQSGKLRTTQRRVREIRLLMVVRAVYAIRVQQALDRGLTDDALWNYVGPAPQPVEPKPPIVIIDEPAQWRRTNGNIPELPRGKC